MVCFFFFKQKTAYEMLRSLVGSEMCIRDSYNTVQFDGDCQGAVLRVKATRGGTLLLQSGNKTLAKIKVPVTEGWKEIPVRVKGIKKGIHHLTVKSVSDHETCLDWIRFTK